MTRRTPSLRTMMVALAALVLVLPTAGVFGFAIFETMLVRQTERRLIAEAVVVGDVFRSHWIEAERDGGLAPGPGSEASGPPREPWVPRISLRRDGVLPELSEPLRRVAPGDGPAWIAGARSQAMLERILDVNLAGIRIVETDGCVVASTNPGRIGACLDGVVEVTDALAGRYGAVARARDRAGETFSYDETRRRGDIRVFVAIPLFADGDVIGAVRMSRTALDPLEVLFEQRQAVFAATVAGFAIAVALAGALALAVRRPVQRLAKEARAVASGARDRLGPPARIAPSEVAELRDAIDAMTRQLAGRAEDAVEFAAQVSHEIKSPVTAIRGAVELLQDGDAMTGDRRARFLSNIDEDARRIERLVTDLLQLARMEAHKPVMRDVEPAAFLKGLADGYGAAVRLSLEDPPARVRAAPERLESAVRNLLDNAVRHRRERPVTLRASTEAGRLVVEVSDDGPGVPDSIRDRVFDRFVTTRSDAGGTGLGLAIVRAFAESRGGRASFESGPGGTTFRLVC